MTDLTEGSSTTVDESHSADDQWTAIDEQPLNENTRTLLRQFGQDAVTNTALQTAYCQIPGIGPENDAIIESVRELAHEQALTNGGEHR